MGALGISFLGGSEPQSVPVEPGRHGLTRAKTIIKGDWLVPIGSEGLRR